MFTDLPWLAILIAVVANMVLGFLWFGPLFGKAWMAAVGKTEEDRPDAGAGMYVAPIVGALIGAIVLWNVMSAMGTTDLVGGIAAAFWVWLGFIAFTGLTNSMFRGDKTALWVLESSAHLVGFAITGAILGLMA